jgi:hypothetical protein
VIAGGSLVGWAARRTARTILEYAPQRHTFPSSATTIAGSSTRGSSGKERDGGHDHARPHWNAPEARNACAATCSTASASAAATAAGFDVDPFTKRTPINSVVCGPFFGGSIQGMAATVAVPTGCGFSIGWGVFRLDNGAWHLVMHQDNGVLKLEAMPLPDGGADIQATQGYPRSFDEPCSPSRMRTQVWH